jgi:hypothetical protein
MARRQPGHQLLLPLPQSIAGRPQVQQGVLARRHVPITHLFADPLQPFGRAFGPAMRPLVKIQPLAPVLHVAGHQPGHRRNVAVPGPAGFLGVTVITGGAQPGGDFRRRRVAGQQIVPRCNRRIGARRVGTLQQCEYRKEPGQNPFQFFLHAIPLDAPAIMKVPARGKPNRTIRRVVSEFEFQAESRSASCPNSQRFRPV